MRHAALWVKSNFSFLEGASHPEELVEQAREHNLVALALTDRDGLYGAVRAHARARELGLHLIVGAQVSVDDGNRLLLLAESRAGHANLCRLLTDGHLRAAKGECAVSWTDICEAAPGLLALCVADPGTRRFEQLSQAYGERLYALVTRHRRPRDAEREQRLRRQAARLGVKAAAGTEVLYHSAGRRPLQDVLTCIREKLRLDQAGRRLRPNAEHELKSPAAMAALFADDPGALRTTLEIAERCTFSLAELRYRYPSERLPGGMTSAEWLRQLTREGARWRYGGRVPEEVQQQLERELELIDELDYPGYFLTMWEIVEFCRAHHILCQGRGSAANSAVCYCLGITAVDPVRMGLLFERFISRERPDPPDIDLDIEHERREEVLQHVYDKYGRSHAAMAAVVVRYRGRSAIREVGKTLGLPETALDRLSKLSHRHDPDGGWVQMLEAAGLDPRAPAHRHLVRLVAEIQDFPRHLSIHPGGFLLGHEPVHDLVPIENATMEARTVIQWDKDDLETLGLFKVDLLGLGALSLMRRGLDLLARHKQTRLSLAQIPHEDPTTYAMIQRGDTVGVFQIESRAQMAMLPRLRPRTYYDLVIEVAIVRPGPIAGDMVHPYLRRRHGLEPVTYPHPCLEPVLAKTLGVPLFQEQVMRLAVVAADYTPGEADQLRRDMAVWRRSGRLGRHRERLITRMVSKGIAVEFAERVFEQIQGFGEYGFPESHAASFALIAYATAWLRCHHPEVFTAALLNAQPLGFYTPATIVEDARRHGVTVRPVDVRFSDWDCTLEPEESDRRQGSAAAHGRTVPRDLTPGQAVRSGPVGSKRTVPRDLTPGQAVRSGPVGSKRTVLRDLTPGQAVRSGSGGPKADRSPGPDARSGRSVRSGGLESGPFSGTGNQVRQNGPVPTEPGPTLAVRMGLRYVARLGEAEGRKLALQARLRPFADLDDFVRRTRLNEGQLTTLAEGGALEGLGLSRRTALWEVRRLLRERHDALPLPREEPLPELPELDALQTITWDYRATGHSPRGHPLEPLRPLLAAQRLPDAREVNAMADETPVRYAGLVINRQQPGTARGVVFMTLEDETGFVNLVLWPDVFQRNAVLARTESFLGVTGKLQKQQGVVHLVVEQLWLPSLAREPARPRSRDFC